MNTNLPPELQIALALTGHHFTTMELTFLCALPTSIAAHFWALVKFWAHVGGWRGVSNFIQTGSITAPVVKDSLTTQISGPNQPGATAETK